jgi:hypothetical protein
LCSCEDARLRKTGYLDDRAWLALSWFRSMKERS